MNKRSLHYVVAGLSVIVVIFLFSNVMHVVRLP
jgi:hypothetical protein